MSQTDPFELVPAGLGPTLAKQGFEKLTQVQEAVLADGLAGRDLRVISQTGSGKTVAIGLVLADDLVAAGADGPRSRGKAFPQVLLIAPTRELAAQLGDELGWLYRPLGKSITVVTGGTNIGLDFQKLKMNPEVLVGTPGRLFDHVKRGSVDLSQVQAVVLDEADEMLDMGFRDELEGILESTPTERRTHMVSATFAREVLALAKRYQNDAVSVQGSNPREANTDISHVAYTIRMGNRLDSLINILLAEPDQRTLVFVRTRVSTANLATDLTAAGFKAFPLNGEMGQRERTATLDAFRSDKVQLLIATDVAARGLDIQNVNRIVHFDLPENHEAFTHRSGRTGRAGAKGTSVLFVPPNARRKVEYITRASKVKLEWNEVPTVRDIRTSAEARLLASFEALAKPVVSEETAASDDGAQAEDGTEAQQQQPARKAIDERLLILAEKLLDGKVATEIVGELLSRINITGPCEPRHIQVNRHDRSSRDLGGRGQDSRHGGREFGRGGRDRGGRGDDRGGRDFGRGGDRGGRGGDRGGRGEDRSEARGGDRDFGRGGDQGHQ
ncbi:MAG: DEAD/DEAH box helicase, partial [Kofleriaceae bacterium]|nr:DEAD/DEAH box helicase [Kofleriaceae bacterium]